jgi:hypothetical protein
MKKIEANHQIDIHIDYKLCLIFNLAFNKFSFFATLISYVGATTTIAPNWLQIDQPVDLHDID